LVFENDIFIAVNFSPMLAIYLWSIRFLIHLVKNLNFCGHPFLFFFKQVEFPYKDALALWENFESGKSPMTGCRQHVTKQNKVYALWPGTAMKKMMKIIMTMMMGMVTTFDGCSGVQFILAGQTTETAKTVIRISYISMPVALINF